MPRTTADYDEAQRERIITGATKVFAANGYRQATMDQIALSLELSKGALYIYFKTKEKLFIAAIRAYNKRRTAPLKDIRESTESVTARLDALLDRFSNLLTTDNQLYIRLWLEGFLQSAHIPAVAILKADIYEQFERLLTKLLTEGKQDGTLNPSVDVENTVLMLQATFDGLMLHTLVNDRGLSPERIRHIIRSTFYQSLFREALQKL